jgi:hypothetical protein
MAGVTLRASRFDERRVGRAGPSAPLFKTGFPRRSARGNSLRDEGYSLRVHFVLVGKATGSLPGHTPPAGQFLRVTQRLFLCSQNPKPSLKNRCFELKNIDFRDRETPIVAASRGYGRATEMRGR